MKPPNLSTDLVSVAELKAQASKLLKKVREEGRPLVITNHGKAAGVLISPEDYDRFFERERFLAAVREGLADADAGRFVSDEELGRDLDEWFGPLDE